MSELIDGFFDEVNHSEFKLWVSNHNEDLLEQLVLSSAVWHKRSKSAKDLSRRLFCLTKTHLYYKKSAHDTKIRGIMPLKFVRVCYIGEELDETGELIYRIKFVRNLKFSELFTESKEVFLQWITLLCPLTIQTNFHQKFKVLKKIGKGAFASVSWSPYFYKV
jgi:hypothetical protein